MKKIILPLLLLLNFISLYASKQLIDTKKVAKIQDDIILAGDVEKYAKLYNISFDEAKKNLIEFTILYNGAKININEPSEDEVDNQINKEKINYAFLMSKKSNEISDEEFIAYLHYNSLSYLNYKKDIKKKLWVSRYRTEIIKKENIEQYIPKENEIKDIIKNKKELFEEKAGIKLSVIFFSFFDKENKLRNSDEIKEIYKKSSECIKEILNGQNFENLAEKYSQDPISLNNSPKGSIGFINLDDDKLLKKFNKEIVEEFKKADAGIINKIFETNKGIYIFKIDEKIPAQKLSNEAVKIKAKSYLEIEHRKSIEKKIIENAVNDLKKTLNIAYY